MKRWLPFLFLLLAASAFAYAPAPRLVLPGAHQLSVSAKHPSGQFTTNTSVWFTNNAAAETVADTFYGGGQIIKRLWNNADGTTNRTQILYWDGRDRLYQMLDWDGQGKGWKTMATYDALGRRLRTWTYALTNNSFIASSPKYITQAYDPEVEFLELGVAVDSATTWKLYGPDLNGVYGGLNGVGGFEGVAPGLNQFSPTISDARGNILGSVTNGIAINWTAARVTGYGAVPGYRPLPLGHGGDLVTSSAWRGRYQEIPGWVNLGARHYRPESGSFESYDPAWNEGDPNYLTYCGDDPINFFDADGRFGKGAKLAYDPLTGYMQRFNAHDAYYLGMDRALAGETVAWWEMPLTDQPSESLNGQSFRMVFGDVATGFAEFGMSATAGLAFGVPAEVADSFRQAGEASVSGEHRGFAYTRAGVSVVMGVIAFEAPARGFVNRSYSSVGRTPTLHEYGVAFFGEDNLKKFYSGERVFIGAPNGKSFFFMPLEDAAKVKSVADAARASGMAPSAARAYTQGGDIYGISFPTTDMKVAVPTAADAGGWAHFLKGGKTAISLGEGKSSGFLINPTREFVTPGGNPPPPGTVIFKLGPNGDWIPIRRF